MKVTGQSITDEQVRELWRHRGNSITGRDLMDALGEAYGPCMRKPTDDEQSAAREHCAAAWNSMFGDEP